MAPFDFQASAQALDQLVADVGFPPVDALNAPARAAVVMASQAIDVLCGIGQTLQRIDSHIEDLHCSLADVADHLDAIRKRLPGGGAAK